MFGRTMLDLSYIKIDQKRLSIVMGEPEMVFSCHGTDNDKLSHKRILSIFIPLTH